MVFAAANLAELVLMAEEGFVCGIDVGGEKKGFHLCILGKDTVELFAHARQPQELISLLEIHLAHRNRKLKCIAVDGPARSFRARNSIRESEAELARRGYRVLYTPAKRPNSQHWMINSETIHRSMAMHFPDSILLETYPSAISDRLFGLEASLPLALFQERRKRKFYGDYIDAYLCALTARKYLENEAEILEDGPADRKHQSPFALPEFSITRATLSFIFNKDQVLLGLKKKGFGKGYWNGFGGKIETGEKPVQAAAREIQEECKLKASRLKPAGKLYFHFDDDPRRIEGFLFTTHKFSGQPEETAEMKPQWYNIHELPFDQMWEDDRFWLPYVLMGKKVHATFRFKKKKMLDYSIEVIH